MEIYLIISVDTECDKGPGWKIQQPLAFKNILTGIPQRLQPLFESHHVKPTYLLSPEVLQNNACVDLLKSLQEKVELGAHLHSEFIHPFAKLQASRSDDFQSEYPKDIEYKKLENVTCLFEDKLGFAPRSFRAGRFGISQYTLSFLEELGYHVDSSVTPTRWWWGTKGQGVNFLGSDNQPYHPSRRDFRKPGNMKIMEVPISIVNPFWDRIPKTIQLAINPLNVYHPKVLNKLLSRHPKSMWLRPTFSSPQEMMSVVERLCAQRRGKSVVLCMMFHSNEATPGMSPYFQSQQEVKNLLKALTVFLDVLYSRYNIQSIGLSEVPDIVG